MFSNKQRGRVVLQTSDYRIILTPTITSLLESLWLLFKTFRFAAKKKIFFFSEIAENLCLAGLFLRIAACCI